MADSEIEALGKCLESLKELDDQAKIRVFKYLFERFELVNLFTNYPINNNLKSQLLEEPKANKETIEIEKIEADSITITPEKIKKKKSSTGGKSLSLIANLNLNPSDKKHLKEFYKEFSVSMNMENNLIFIYYLNKIINEENISPNHIYTCYKHLGLKVPSIYQSISDTRSRKGWIDTSNMADIKITISGENYIEHDIKKLVNV